MRACDEARWGLDDGTCPKCGVSCGPDDRYPNLRQCKKCVIARVMADQQSYTGEALERRREVGRTAQRKLKYGITREQYNQMVEARGGRCDVCGDVAILVVEHDHACCSSNTKTCGDCICGLVCSDCNTMMGFGRDSADRLAAGAVYLRRTRLGSSTPSDLERIQTTTPEGGR